MKALQLISTLGLAATLAACGNDNWLSQLSGANTNQSTQQQAVEDLADNYCADCNAPEGGATELFADVTPEEYAGGPLELALRIGSPHGVVDETGNWTVDVLFEMNEFDFFAALPAEAWLFSADRTMARVVLLAEGGLPAGHYFAKGAICQGAPEEPGEETPGEETPGETPDAPAEGGETAFMPEDGGCADDHEVYEVPGEEEHPDEHPDDGEPEPDPTPDGEPEPDPTPTEGGADI